VKNTLSRPNGSQGRATGRLFFTALSVLQLAIIFACREQISVTPTLAVLLLAISSGGAMLAKLAVAQGERTPAIIALSFSLFLLLIPAALQTAAGVYPFYRRTYPESSTLAAAVICFSFLLSSAASYIYFRPKPVGQTTASRRLSITNSYVVLLALAAICALGIATIGVTNLLARRDTFTYVEQTPVQIAFRALVGYASFCGLALSIILYKGLKSPLHVIFIFISATLFLTLNNPVNVARFGFLSLTIALLFVATNPEKLSFKASIIAAFAIGQSTIFPVLNYVSRGARGAEAIINPIKYYTYSGDFDGFQSVVNAYEMVAGQGVSFGRRLLSAILVFIPRSVWEGKEAPTGVDAAAYAGYAFTNISMPLPGEAIADFGWFGILPFAVFLGWAVARFERDAELSRKQGHLVSLLPVAIFAGSLPIVLRGSLLAVAAPVALGLLLSLAVARFATSTPARA
jgi:oligosaccharide repeat unit polymerase